MEKFWGSPKDWEVWDIPKDWNNWGNPKQNINPCPEDLFIHINLHI